MPLDRLAADAVTAATDRDDGPARPAGARGGGRSRPSLLVSVLVVANVVVLIVIGVRVSAVSRHGRQADAPLTASPSGWRHVTDAAAGVSFDVPDGWMAETASPPGNGSSPAPLAVVANRPLSTTGSLCDDHGFYEPPPSALEATDVVLRILERTASAAVPSTAPPADQPWPTRSGANGGGRACDNAPARQWRFDTVDNGRAVHIIVIEGDDASDDDREALWTALDRMRFVSSVP